MREASAGTSSMVEAALRRYEQHALARLTIIRTVMLLAVFAWITSNYGAAIASRHAAVLGAFVLFGIVQYLILHRWPEWRWVSYVFLVLDIGLLTVELLAPGRLYPEAWPWQTVLRQPSFMYLYLFIALSALTFRPRLVLWAGFCVVVAWSIGVWTIIGQPDTIDRLPKADSTTALLANYLDPNYVHVDDWAVRMFVTVLVSLILAAAANRARTLVMEQAEAARERANLARYVSPGMVERMAMSDRPMGIVRGQDAAVLFADIRGFTAIAEQLTPEATMGLLSAFHTRMTEAVFDFHGTLDKFTGDGLMATFGTPETGPRDAANALDCATAMLARLDLWNAQRGRKGRAPITVGIGVHYGPVTLGDIGGAQRFEFAVIGDTVNVASRLERLTRVVDRALIVSDALVEQVAAETGAKPGKLVCLGEQRLSGKSEPLVVWSDGLPLVVAPALATRANIATSLPEVVASPA